MDYKSNKRVSVVIVTYGAGDYLWRCLDSLKEQTYQASEITLIDNSQDQDLAQKIKNSYPAVSLYSAAQNLFYCKALNIGINASCAEFILCLNDDVRLEKTFIESALKGFEANEKIGMVSGKILRSNKVTIDSCGLFLNYFRCAKERGYGKKDLGKFDKEEYVFGVNGAVAFYRKKMLEEIKIGPDYFDEDYRMFFEDLDLAWRAQNFGWKAYYVPAAIAYHVRGGSFRPEGALDKPFARRFLNNDLHADLIKNRYLSIIKNESVLGLLLHLPGIMLYDLFMWLYCICLRPIAAAIFIKNLFFLGRALKKRAIIREKINSSVDK